MAVNKKNCQEISGKRTKWLGLWYHPEYWGFSSQSINLSVLKDFKGCVRILVKKNRFYNNGENGRPNYVFCIKDADSETFQSLELEDDTGSGLFLVTRDDIQGIVNDAVSNVIEDHEGGYYVTDDDILRNGGRAYG